MAFISSKVKAFKDDLFPAEDKKFIKAKLIMHHVLLDNFIEPTDTISNNDRTPLSILSNSKEPVRYKSKGFNHCVVLQILRIGTPGKKEAFIFTLTNLNTNKNSDPISITTGDIDTFLSTQNEFAILYLDTIHRITNTVLTFLRGKPSASTGLNIMNNVKDPCSEAEITEYLYT
ncbi:uncharacterized protein LOC135836208 [Planococcus citri]|uniref:uncharacterized protein LOC135836208 n=1 Tax=Planococcus citri TaxID=170843 RepID=UPI0031F9A39D